MQSITIPSSVTVIEKNTFSYCTNLQSVTIPSSVTTIGESAFAGCTKLQSVVIPEGVTTIGERAFYECRNLQSVVIPEGVTEIGRYVFYECRNLQNVVIPDSVTTIGESAFQLCTKLQSVVIPEGVTTIGRRAFSECTNLQSVVIPDSVTTIGEYAFYHCKIDILEHKVLKIKDDCAFSGDGLTFLYKLNNSTEFTIPDSVTAIGDYAFSGFTTITIPNSVTTIGEIALPHSLQEVKYLGTAKEWGKVKFANSKEKAEIRKLIKAFTLQNAKDSKIKEIKTVGVEGIMNAMKENYPSLNFQVLNTTKTNYALFVMSGKNATVIQLSSNVSSWSEKVQSFLSVFCDETKTNEEIEEAFTTYKIKIAEIKKTFSKPQIDVDEMNLFIDELPELKREKEYDSDSVSFFYNAKIKKLTFARNTLIDWCTFRENKSFESIILPKNVTTIGESAFLRCTNLQNVVIPEGVTKIGRYAFCDCTNLQNVVIPSSVTKIGESAFRDCTNLKSVVIPEGVTTIGGYAFEGGTNLQNVDIPEGVTEIGESAFYSCTNLTVTFDGTKEEWEKIQGVEDCFAENVKFNK